jgi:hypothetical protein
VFPNVAVLLLMRAVRQGVKSADEDGARHS